MRDGGRQSRNGIDLLRRDGFVRVIGEARNEAVRVSRSGGKRELLLVVLFATALAIAMTWPLAAHIGTEMPSDPVDVQDPLLEAWTVAWGGHALLHSPLHFFDANVFWPLHSSLAFSDSLAGYAVTALVGHGLVAAAVRYDLLFLFSYVLAFVGAYLLARELGARPLGAGVAGAAFAYAPFRLGHQSQLQLLSSGGIPLSIFLLIRGYRTERGRLVVAGWLVALWQVSLSWNLGLPFVYFLGFAAAAAAVSWLYRGRPQLRSGVKVATAVGATVFVVGTLALALPYAHVLHDHPESRRTPDILFFFSPSPRSFLAAPSQDLVWGSVTKSVRSSPGFEKSLFPGATVLVLGIIGLLRGRYSRKLRVALAILVVVFAALSLGFGLHGGRGGYRLLYDYAPGWQGLRTPGRLVTFTTLALALLAATGADRVADAFRYFGSKVAVAVGALLIAFVLFEGAGDIDRIHTPHLPAMPPHPQPELVLPPDSDVANATAMFWSIDGFPALVNGWSGFHPTKFTDLVSRITDFPDAASVRALRSYGVKTVIVDHRLVPGTSWAAAGGRPIAGLGITRRTVGPLTVYVLGKGTG